MTKIRNMYLDQIRRADEMIPEIQKAINDLEHALTQVQRDRARAQQELLEYVVQTPYRIIDGQ